MARKKTPAAFAGRTIVCAVLDRSGSMAHLVPETIGGYNGFIDKLKADKLPKHFVTLTVFDTDVDVLYAMTDLEQVPALTRDDYKIGGMTALYDALAETINAVDQQVTADDRVLVLLITDGQENSSKEVTTAAKMKEIIDRYTARANWTFTYLSASPTAFADSGSIGVAAGNTQAYQATRTGTQQAFVRVAHSTANYSGQSVSASACFYAGDPPSKPAAPVVAPTPKAKRKSVAEQIREKTA